MKKPKELLELEALANSFNVPSDILDDLQAEEGFVELTLVSGEKVFGKPDCITWDGEDGLDKHIRFLPFYNLNDTGIYYSAEDIKSFMPCTEDGIPVYE